MNTNSIDLETPRITVMQVAEWCRVSPNTLRSWMQAGTLILKDAELAPAGGTRLLTGRRVLQIAVMAELIRMGVAPGPASQHALAFSDFADDVVMPWAGGLERDPGGLYRPNAYSWLVAHPDENWPRIVAIVPGVDCTDRLRDINGALRRMIILPLDEVVMPIFEKLQA